MGCFKNISSNQLAILATLGGVFVASQMNSDEQNTTGNLLQAIGQIILLVNAQQQLLSDESPSATNSCTDCPYKNMQEQLNSIEAMIKKGIIKGE